MSNDLKIKYKDPDRPETTRFLPGGEYPFTVKEMYAVSVAKSGNSMIPFEVTLHGPNGEQVKAEDCLVFTANSLWKFDQFIAATLPFIKPGETIDFAIPADIQRFKNKRGRCVVSVEEYVNKKGQPGKKNVIESYLPATEAPAETPPATEEVEDDIPF